MNAATAKARKRSAKAYCQLKRPFFVPVAAICE